MGQIQIIPISNVCKGQVVFAVQTYLQLMGGSQGQQKNPMLFCELLTLTFQQLESKFLISSTSVFVSLWLLLGALPLKVA